MRNNNQEYQKKIYAGSGCCARQKGEEIGRAHV